MTQTAYKENQPNMRLNQILYSLIGVFGGILGFFLFSYFTFINPNFLLSLLYIGVVFVGIIALYHLFSE